MIDETSLESVEIISVPEAPTELSYVLEIILVAEKLKLLGVLIEVDTVSIELSPGIPISRYGI